jgi:hypothetical protein
VIHSHALSNLEIEPRLTRQAGSKGLPDRLNFYFFDWQGRSSHSYDLLDARSHQDRPSIVKVESTKQIAWEKWLFDLFYSVGPTTLTLVDRQKALISLPHQLAENLALASGPHLQRKPWQLRKPLWFE